MYVYFNDVNNGLIQLVSLDLNSYDGGEYAKWIVKKEIDCFFSIRSKVDTNYAITVNAEHNNVVLKTIENGKISIDQEWILHKSR